MSHLFDIQHKQNCIAMSHLFDIQHKQNDIHILLYFITYYFIGDEAIKYAYAIYLSIYLSIYLFLVSI